MGVLLQDFDLEVKYRKGTENQVIGRLSILVNETTQELGENTKIDDAHPDGNVLDASKDLIHGLVI